MNLLLKEGAKCQKVTENLILIDAFTNYLPSSLKYNIKEVVKREISTVLMTKSKIFNC